MPSEPFIGTIMMFGGTFAPRGWAFCDGQLLSIAENDALWLLLGTTYGGDGQTTFALPNLQSRVPIHQGQGPGSTVYPIGGFGGEEAVTLTVNQISGHTHGLGSGVAASTAIPTVSPPATAARAVYGSAPDGNMATNSIGITGGNQPHTNLQPYLTLHFVIAVEGVFPSPS